jgi:hypothetical protein
MDLDLLLRELNPTEINAFVRALPTRADFALTLDVLRQRSIPNIKFQTSSGRRQVNAARFRSFGAPTALATRQATRVVSEGMLPPLGQTLTVSEMETILFNISHGQDATQFQEQLYNDVERHVESIRTTQELAAGKLLATGVVPLAGLTDIEVDWNVPDANMPTVSTYWSDAEGATPLTDELRWMAYLRTSGAPTPGRVITSLRALSTLASSLEYRAAFFNTGTSGTTPTATLAPDQVNTVRARYNLPPVQLYDVQVFDENGNYVRVLPDNLWIMIPGIPNTQWGETLYGLTAEGIQLSSGTDAAITAEEAPGILVVTKVEDDPVQIYTRGVAVGMPVLYVPDIHITATVLAPDGD